MQTITLTASAAPLPAGKTFAYINLRWVDSLGAAKETAILAADIPNGAASISAPVPLLAPGTATVSVQAYASGAFALGTAVSAQFDVPVTPGTTYPQVLTITIV
jgi:hypothetical protein